jgi:hypothetical protein
MRTINQIKHCGRRSVMVKTFTAGGSSVRELSALTVIPSHVINHGLTRRNDMETMIELTDAELDAVVGGVGTATFDVTATASGPFSTISGTLSIATTVSSASVSGSFYSESDSA